MKKDTRSLNPEAQEVIRIKAVKAVIAGKRSRREVALLFDVCHEVVGKWVKRYKQGGLKALRKKRKGRPVQSGKLLPWQSAVIVKTVSDKTPDQLKFPFVLWTCDAVALLIRDKYGIVFSRWTVGRLLKKWGFTPQKPAKRSYFQNNQEVRNWLRDEYPAIAIRARSEGGEIQWCDEMGARSDDQVGRTYSKRGRTPVIKVSGLRFSCNMISSLTNLGKLRFMVFKERFTAEVFIDFLTRLVKSSGRKVFFIVDSHPVHKTSKKVREWLGNHRDRIELFFLPTYSPELNPTEYLNQDVKTNALRKKRAKNQLEMVENIHRFMKSRQKQPMKVKKYFQARHVKYAA